MSNPKLALIPSGYKESIVYSVLPNNATGNFTFSRTGSATRVRADGLIETVAENIPRLDYLGTECPSLLLEAQETNSITYSESATGKSLTGITLTNEQAVSPTGEYTAMLMKEDTSTGKHRFSTNSIFGLGGVSYSFSMFVKKNSDNRFVFINAGAFMGVSGSFNLDTQAVTGSVQLLNNYGDGWYRIGISATKPGTGTGNILVQMQEGTTDADYTGDESSVFVWGLQFEQASTPTSYIPTTSSSVTRNAETCSITTPSGVTQIVETFSDNTTNTITTIPSTYSISSGRIKKVIMT